MGEHATGAQELQGQQQLQGQHERQGLAGEVQGAPEEGGAEAESRAPALLVGGAGWLRQEDAARSARPRARSSSSCPEHRDAACGASWLGVSARCDAGLLLLDKPVDLCLAQCVAGGLSLSLSLKEKGQHVYCRQAASSVESSTCAAGLLQAARTQAAGGVACEAQQGYLTWHGIGTDSIPLPACIGGAANRAVYHLGCCQHGLSDACDNC